MVWGIEARAKSMLDKGDAQSAAEILRRAIARESRANPRRLNLLGVCEAHSGHLATARELFSSVLSEFPHNASALTNMGNLAFLEGDQEGARQYYVRALQQNVFLQEPRFNLVRSYQYMGHFEKAMTAYQDYVAVARLNRWSHLALLFLVVLLGVLALLARR